MFYEDQARVQLLTLFFITCLSVGCTPNVHSYAFRRVRQLKNEPETPLREVECWIGPRMSTSIDAFFQPFYVGGALANDRKILLGDLFVPDDGETLLQYVHDFGDWWSHTITITRSEIPPLDGTTVAHLDSGSGSCPPEDCGGILEYCKKMAKLSGRRPLTSDDVHELSEYSDKKGENTDPSRPLWWKAWNAELRGKHNTASLRNPLHFDIEKHRLSLEDTLRQLVVVGTEHEQTQVRKPDNGISQTGGLNGFPRRKDSKPTDECAVCGVTASLKLCSGCKSVAFCCRGHQVDFWPEHKAACLALQKKLKDKQRK